MASLLFRSSFQLNDLLDGPLVKEVTADTVTGFGRIAHNSTVFQLFNCSVDEPLLGVFRVYLKQHCLGVPFYLKQHVVTVPRVDMVKFLSYC